MYGHTSDDTTRAAIDSLAGRRALDASRTYPKTASDLLLSWSG
jgi:hypothetical protein